MFSGIYYHSLDTKNRLIIPSKLREAADKIKKGDDFFLTRGLDDCLFLFPSVFFDDIAKRINKLSFTKRDPRTFQRMFFSMTVPVSFDKQGRILVPDSHIALGKLRRKCIILGVAERIEIWDEDLWKEFDSKNSAAFDAIAENLYFPDTGESQ